MKALAIVCATANLLAIGFAAFVMWLLAVLPLENQTPEDEAAEPWLMAAAVVLALSAVGLLVSVAMSWRRWATTAFVLQLAVSLVVLGFALDESEGEGRLVSFALAVQMAGLCAVMLSRGYPSVLKRTT